MTATVTLAEQIKEVEREIAMRRRVYPEWVRNGKLSQALADRNMACIEAALTTLLWLQRNEARIRDALRGQGK